MPNGDGSYNYLLCKEKHSNIDKTFEAQWDKISGLEKKLWGILVLLLINAGGIIGVLIKV